MTEVHPAGRSYALRLAGTAAALLALRQAWLIGKAVRTQQRSRPYQARPAHRRARILLVGDSTGVGGGAVPPDRSLPALLAAAYPRLEIINRCASGARVRDTLGQAQRAAESRQRFDLALVLAGGNDVLRLTGAHALREDAAHLVDVLERVADRVVWLGCANIGVAPAALAPVSWWLSRRTQRSMQLLAQVAREHGATFIDFSADAHTSRFVDDPNTYFAADGVHPSSAAHRYCFLTLQAQLRELGVSTRTWEAGPTLAALRPA